MRNPILAKNRLMEPWATDTWYWKVTSYECHNYCQLFVGQKSYHIYLYGMVTESEGPTALLVDFFRDVGVPISLRRDNSKMQTSEIQSSYIRKYNCSDNFIEHYNPQQYPAEIYIGFLENTIKTPFADIGCDPLELCLVLSTTQLMSVSAPPTSPLTG